MSKNGKVRPRYSRHVEWIPVKMIGIEPSAQRPFDEAYARRLAEKLDPDALGLPVVGVLVDQRGRERYIAVDGQHRIAAVRRKFDEEHSVQCLVIRGLTIPQAAELFCELNTTRNPRVIHQFLPGVTAQREENVTITRIVEGLGLHITANKGEGAVSAVGALMAIYRKDSATAENGTLLTHVLTLALNAWGGNADAFNGNVLRGLSSILSRYDGLVDSEVLQRKLSSVAGGALGILARGRACQQAERGPLADCIARAIVGLYNTGRRSRALPAWGTKLPKADIQDDAR